MENRIWAGTDDGLIHLTTDARQELDRRDAATDRPVVENFPDGREPFRCEERLRGGQYDPARRSAPAHLPDDTTTAKPGRKSCAAFRATRTSTWCAKIRSAADCCSRARSAAVYVSFDDGDNWQSLRLNLPATSVRDLIVKDDDLAIATHGRGFWILDNITPLRQLKPNEQATRSCSNRRPRCACAGIRTPTRPCHPMSRPAKILQKAR